MLNRVLLSAAVVALGACASASPRGTEVTRFHLGQSIPAQTVNIQLADPARAGSLEFDSFIAVVVAELANAGFVVEDGEAAELIAAVDVQRGMQQRAPRRSPFSVGVGGGSFGGNVGVSGGVSMPVGGSRGGEIFVTELEVKLIRRAERAISWEGRAVRITESGEGSPTAVVQQLASALFSDFPGESGKTVTVP